MGAAQRTKPANRSPGGVPLPLPGKMGLKGEAQGFSRGRQEIIHPKESHAPEQPS